MLRVNGIIPGEAGPAAAIGRSDALTPLADCRPRVRASNDIEPEQFGRMPTRSADPAAPAPPDRSQKGNASVSRTNAVLGTRGLSRSPNNTARSTDHEIVRLHATNWKTAHGELDLVL